MQSAVSVDDAPLDNKTLRDFGLLLGGMVAALFGVFFPWFLERSFPLWPWVVLAVLAGAALLAPGTLRILYRVWMRLGVLLSKITTPIILGVAFVTTIIPVAVIMKLIRHDPMARHWNRDIDSYRVPSEDTDKDSLEKPY
ncbi:MAG: SxtJ family membrane protein [Gammaproteobacteria bacterium]|nr:SxtJ family membrane protein [Gammaproteobacteria bacterium]